MEMPEHEIPIVFSQMLQLFPNVPHDIVWIYVQRYSSDIEKCAQMLNLQSGKYTDSKPSSPLDNSKHLNDYKIFIQPSHKIPSSKTIFDNNNEAHLTNQLPLINNEVKVTTKEGVSDSQQSECLAISTQSSHPVALVSPHTEYESVVRTDSCSNLNSSINCHEPLLLHINVDDDGSLHSWRPNLTTDVLCSDFFLPSPMFENFQLTSNHVTNVNSQHSVSESQMSPEGMKEKTLDCNNTPVHIHYEFPWQSERPYWNNIANHLHYQKSQMNAVRYEVIKAKIELSNLKEIEEKLQLELKEKMQSKSVQDIENLNKEIVQLRLECQCLCTEVDYSLNDQVLLGEVDESCYERNDSSINNTEIQNPVSDHSAHSQNESTDVQHESHRWQCPKCTFANHPAIKVCEMCHVPKPSTRNPPYLAAVPTSCYCHPKEGSLSVHS